MANTKAKRHTHKYYKSRPYKGGEYLWTCALPTCSHHMPKHMEHTLHGKATICWGCDEAMILDERAWKLDKPLCTDCDPTSMPVETMDPELVEKLKEMGVLGKLE
jgi:hypothetical protein